jgi:hypothetical protein
MSIPTIGLQLNGVEQAAVQAFRKAHLQTKPVQPVIEEPPVVEVPVETKSKGKSSAKVEDKTESPKL